MEGRKKWVVKITYIGDSKPIPPTESQSIEEESRSESSLKSNASSAIAIKSMCEMNKPALSTPNSRETCSNVKKVVQKTFLKSKVTPKTRGKKKRSVMESRSGQQKDDTNSTPKQRSNIKALYPSMPALSESEDTEISTQKQMSNIEGEKSLMPGTSIDIGGKETNGCSNGDILSGSTKMVTDQLFLPKHNGRLKQSLSVTSVSSENSELTSLEQVGNDKSVMDISREEKAELKVIEETVRSPEPVVEVFAPVPVLLDESELHSTEKVITKKDSTKKATSGALTIGVTKRKYDSKPHCNNSEYTPQFKIPRLSKNAENDPKEEGKIPKTSIDPLKKQNAEANNANELKSSQELMRALKESRENFFRIVNGNQCK